MADFSNIKQETSNVIHNNEKGEITAEKLRELELNIIDTINTLKQDVLSNLTDEQRIQVLANINDQTANSTIGKMGYKVLQPYNEQDPSTAFAEQIKDLPNTIFEIRDVFDLDSESVTIPTNCILKFNGGKIFNGEILYQNTCIEGDATMEVDIAQGSSIKGSIVCCEWFGLKANDNTFDNGIIINKVLNRFKNVTIQQKGTYYVKTPIVGDNVKYINFLGSFTYNGSNNTNFAVITVQNSDKAEIYINQISAYNSDINFDNFGKTTSIRGLDVINCTNSNVSVSNMSFLNEGIRLMGYGSTGGCVYNTVHDCNLSYTNVAIRVSQDGRGWANENYFHRIRHITYSDFNKDAVLFLVYGPKWEDSTNSTDSYDTCNGLVIKECSCENNQYGSNVYANLFHNLTSSFIQIARAESVRVVANFDGSSKHNVFDVVGLTGRLFTTSNLNRNSGPIYILNQSDIHKESLHYDETMIYKANGKYFIDGMYTMAHLGTYSIGSTNFELDVNYAPTYNINIPYENPAFMARNSGVNGNLIVRASGNYRLYIRYLTCIINNEEVSISDNWSSYPKPGGSAFAFVENGRCFRTEAPNNNLLITLPDNIRDFLVMIHPEGSNPSPFSYDVDFSNVYAKLRGIRRCGRADQKSLNVRAGTVYTELDTGNVVLFNGTAWVNLDGTALT